METGLQRSDLFAPCPGSANPRATAALVPGMERAERSGRSLRVLVACEFSGIVRDAFAALGHDAWSCDVLPSEKPGNHLQCDVREVLASGWDIMIAHPPCTRLCNSGVRWLHERNLWDEMREACAFFRALLHAPVPMIAVENPIPHKYARSQIEVPYDQIIQPWQFGHSETKATCLWLKNLPKLVPTDIRRFREARVHRMPPGPNRWRERSRTFHGVAEAMAFQWGGGAERQGDVLATRSRAGSQTVRISDPAP